MMDANFRAQCKDCGFDDIELAPGWVYYVEERAYQAHIASCADEKELVSVCQIEGVPSFTISSTRKIPVLPNTMQSDRQIYVRRAMSHQESAPYFVHAMLLSGGTALGTCNKASGESIFTTRSPSLAYSRGLTRQANMDYLYFSTLVGVYLLLLLISYDIVCQWARHLFK